MEIRRIRCPLLWINEVGSLSCNNILTLRICDYMVTLTMHLLVLSVLHRVMQLKIFANWTAIYVYYVHFWHAPFEHFLVTFPFISFIANNTYTYRYTKILLALKCCRLQEMLAMYNNLKNSKPKAMYSNASNMWTSI